MRRCFHCGKTSQSETLIAVGDGEFCQACFDALLLAEGARVETPSRAEPSPRELPLLRPERSVSSRAGCLVCEGELIGASVQVFLGGALCGACSAELAVELEAASAASMEPSPDPSAAPKHAELMPEMFTPGSSTRICAGCERPMPGPGSYRLIDGNPYCAGCLPFYANRHAPAASAASASSAASPPLGAESSLPAQEKLPANECDCCRRPRELGLRERDGFRLCAACLASDVDLALGIARARHRRELLRLRAALEGNT